MKKLLGIVVLGLLLSGNAYAKPIILACTDDDPGPNTIRVDYYSLDMDNKKFSYVGQKTTAKQCALGNCEEIAKANRSLALIYDEPNYVSIGIEDQDQHTFNKKDLSLTWASYYLSEIGSSNTFKKVDTLYYYSCKKINKRPF